MYLTLKMPSVFFQKKAVIDYFCIPDNILCLPPTFEKAIVFKNAYPFFFFWGGGGGEGGQKELIIES